jgi:hypothetical protein
MVGEIKPCAQNAVPDPSVGKENFAAYMRANNRAAAVPTILPALSLLIVSVLLMVYGPGFIRMYEAAAGLVLNLIALESTLVWPRRIQGEMAELDPDGGTSGACCPGHPDSATHARPHCYSCFLMLRSAC